MPQAYLSYEELRVILDNLPNPSDARWLDIVRLLEAAEDLGVRALLAAGQGKNQFSLMPYLEIAAEMEWTNAESRRRVLACLLQYLVVEDKNSRSIAMNIMTTILRRYPDKALQGQLLGLLYDEDVFFRQTVIQMYDRLRDEQAVPYLATLLDDLDNTIRYMSQRALLNINSPSAQYALAEWEKRQSTTP